MSSSLSHFSLVFVFLFSTHVPVFKGVDIISSFFLFFFFDNALEQIKPKVKMKKSPLRFGTSGVSGRRRRNKTNDRDEERETVEGGEGGCGCGGGGQGRVACGCTD